MSSHIIIGGGVIGLLCARALSLEGHKVLLLEQDSATGHQASWAGGGIGAPVRPWELPEVATVMCQRGAELYTKLAEELLQETGYDIEWWQSGLLVFEFTEQEQAIAWAKQHQLPLEILTAAQVKKLAPHVNCTADDNLWMPSIAQVRNPRLLKALYASLQKNKVEIKTNCAVTGFLQQGDAVTGVQTTQGTFTADNVIITAGAWTADLLAKLGLVAPIFPVRGQILLWQLTENLLSTIISAGEHYLIPRQDKYILAGGTTEQVGFDDSTTPEAYDDIYAYAIKLLPELKDQPVVKHWAGLRPGSADGIPYVGAIPGIKNLWINAGHYRNGLNMAPAATELLMDLMFGRKPILSSEPYQWKLK
jgi:glycine oxidase